MILTDSDIREQVFSASHPMIQPYRDEQLNPASYDLTLGADMLLESEDGGFTTFDISGYSQKLPFLLNPGAFCLLHSQEKFYLPHNVAAQVVLKSSRGRAGYQHLMAGFCDPGWHGSVLTMEIKNERQFAQLPIWYGMRMVQMVFILCTGPVMKPYQGSYNNDTTVKQAKY